VPAMSFSSVIPQKAYAPRVGTPIHREQVWNADGSLYLYPKQDASCGTGSSMMMEETSYKNLERRMDKLCIERAVKEVLLAIGEDPD
jgi:hypothetical protein